MLPWQKIVTWLSTTTFLMVVAWATWATIAVTTAQGAQAETEHRLARIELVIGSVLELKADIRVLSAELAATEEQLKRNACFNQ